MIDYERHSTLRWRTSSYSATQTNCVEVALVPAGWRKSSHSGDTNCVEVSLGADAIAVRDSKDPAGPALTFSPAAFHAFLAHAKADALG